VTLSLSNARSLSLALFWICAVPQAHEPEVESPRVRALNPVDGIAIVQEPQGTLRTVHPGDDVSDLLAVAGRFKVTKVLEDRLVIEGILASGGKAKLWVYKVIPGDETSRVVVLEGRTESERRASPRKEPR
jgi:hypothetical protein